MAQIFFFGVQCDFDHFDRKDQSVLLFAHDGNDDDDDGALLLLISVLHWRAGFGKCL